MNSHITRSAVTSGAFSRAWDVLRRTLFSPFCLVLATFCSASLSAHAVTERARVSWAPNTESDLAGYVVRWRPLGGFQVSEQRVGLATTTIVEGLQRGWAYQFTVSAFNNLGLEGDPSNPVTHQAGINTPPTAQDIVLTTPEDTSTNLVFAGSDPDGAPVSFAIHTPPINGTISGLAPDFAYTPNPNFFGTDSFTYTAFDGFALSTPATVRVTVTPMSDAPTVGSSTYSTPEDTNLPLVLNASDPDQDPLTFTFATLPTFGTLLGTPPNLTYRPAPNYHGPDSFSFSVSDGQFTSEVAVVSIAVTPVNDPPTAVALSLTLAEDTSSTFALVGNDIEGSPVTFAVTQPPRFGTLIGTPPNLTYRPVTNFSGADSFSFVASDGTLISPETTVSLTVTPVNDAPTALPASFAAQALVPLPITLTGVDPENSSLGFSVLAGPAKGVLTGIAPNLIYLANPLFSGTDSFTFRVSDGSLTSPPATITILVSSSNGAPVATATSVSTQEDSPLPIVLTGTDPDGSPLTFAIQQSPSSGTLSGTPPNLTYRPNTNYSGPDSFTFTVSDGILVSVAATVSITVVGVNDPPVANPVSVSTPEDTSLPIVLTGSDVEGSSLTYAIATQPTSGTLSGTPPSLTYTPNANFSGSDSFTFTTFDGGRISAPATVSIAVTAVNDRPVAASFSRTLAEDSTVVTPLTASDVESTTLAFAIVRAPGFGTLTGTAPNLTYRPNANYFGSDSFTYTASDGSLTSTVATVSLTITPVNDTPVANPASFSGLATSPILATLTGSDVEGSPLSFTVVSTPANGTLSGTPPNLAYLANPGFAGSDSFTFTVSDGSLTSAPATISLTVTSGNRAPTASPASYSLAEDSTRSITLTGSDPDGNTLSFSVTQPPAFGTLSGSAPNLVYQPNNNYAGPDSFAFTASDGSLTSAPATVALTVTPVNDAPSAIPLVRALDEDAELDILLLGSDPDSSNLAFAIVNPPAFGTLSGSTSNRTYKPNLNFSGSDSFTYTVSDGSLTSAPATVAITVNPVNDAPVAQPASFSGLNTTPIAVTLAGSDVEASPLSFAVASSPAHGTLSGTPPNLTYQANSGFAGSDSFTFTVSDGSLTSAPATVAITVTPGNRAPTASPASYSLAEDSTRSITLTGSDPDGNSLSFTVTQPPAFGTLSGTAPSLLYRPNPNYNGTDSFRFTAFDGSLTSAPATVSLTVTPVNDAPVAQPGSFSGLNTTPIAVTLAGSDVEGSPLSFTVASSPANGTLSGTPPNLAYRANSGFTGTDAFTFTVSDGSLTSAPATVALTVTSGNRAPTASPASYSLAEDSTRSITLTGSDPDGNTLSFTVTQPPAFGTLSGSAPNLVYQPNSNYAGPDSFAFTASDGSLTSAPATVAITVTPVNDAPSAISLVRTLDEDSERVIGFIATDPDSSSFSFTVVSLPAFGSLSTTSSNATYKPNPNFFGSDSFTYSASDGSLTSPPVTVYITVNPVNDAPIAQSASFSGLNTGPIAITLAGSDVEGSPLSFAVASTPANGTLSGTPPNLAYRANSGFTGTDAFTFTVSDGSLTSAPATVALTVTSGNRAPTASPASYSLAEDSTRSITLSGSDPDGNALSFTVTQPPAFGTLSGSAPNLVYQPNSNYAGPDSFAFTVSDGSLTSAPATVALTVTPVNDAPSAISLVRTLDEDSERVIGFIATDPDSSSFSFTVVSLPAFGSLSTTSSNATYKPNPNFFGSDSFTYSASDGSLTSPPVTVYITVNPVNDAPIAQSASFSGLNTGPIAITLAGSDVEGSPLSFAVASTPANGTLSGTPPNLAYRANSGFAGSDSFTFTVSDGSLTSAPATVALTVTSGNRAPTASPASYSLAEDSTRSITLSGSDPDGNALSFTVTQPPAFGTLSGSAPNLVYQPNSNYAGPDSFAFTVSDGSLTSAPASVALTVTPVNDAPVAVSLHRALDEDTERVIGFIATDPDSSSFSFTVVSLPAFGSLSTTSSNATYKPNPNFFGSDSFTYSASDGSLTSPPVTVYITVNPVNDAPIAQSASFSGLNTGPIAITLAGSDVEGSPLSFAVASTPANGTLSGTPPNLAYRANSGFAGSDSFTFTVSDGSLTSAPATVALTVTSGNRAPTASPASYSLAEDSTRSITLSGSDPDGNALSFTVTQPPAFGTLSGSAPNLVYQPNSNYAGPDSFAFTVSDGSLTSAPASVALTVTPVNDAPVAQPASFSGLNTGPIAVTLAGSDVEGSLLSFTVVSGPANGTLSGTPPNLAYRANSGFAGSDSFTFTVSDGSLSSAPASVALTITLGNRAPTASPALYLLAEDSSRSITLTGSDLDRDSLTFAITQAPAFGTLSGSAPNLIYLPNTNYTGSDSFAFTASDGSLTSAPATVSLTVTPVNDAPVALATSASGLNTGPIAVTLAGSDVEGSPLSFAVASTPANGTLSGTPPNLAYRANSGFAGSDSFTFTVSDGSLTSAPATVAITVTGVQPPPSLENDLLVVLRGETATALYSGATSVLSNDTLPGATPANAVLLTPPAHGTVSLMPDGRFTYRHHGGTAAEDSFTYSIDSLQGPVLEASVRIGVLDIQGITRQGTDVSLLFPVIAGLQYQVEFSTDSPGTSGNWQTLASFTASSDGDASMVVYQVGDPLRFYRVITFGGFGTLVTQPWGHWSPTPSTRFEYANPFHGRPVRNGIATDISTSTVSLQGTQWGANDLKQRDGFPSHIVVVKADGASPGAGEWWPILDHDANTLTLGTANRPLVNSLATGTPLEIVALPTVAEVFGIPTATDCKLANGDSIVFRGEARSSTWTLSCSPTALGVLSYFVTRGTTRFGPYDGTTLTILPAQACSYTRLSGPPTPVFLSGRVHNTPFAHYLVSGISHVASAYPTSITLDGSGILNPAWTPDTDLSVNPQTDDFLWLTDEPAPGATDPANSQAIYHDGSMRAAGWYTGSGTPAGSRRLLMGLPAQISLAPRTETFLWLEPSPWP